MPAHMLPSILRPRRPVFKAPPKRTWRPSILLPRKTKIVRRAEPATRVKRRRAPKRTTKRTTKRATKRLAGLPGVPPLPPHAPNQWAPGDELGHAWDVRLARVELVDDPLPTDCAWIDLGGWAWTDWAPVLTAHWAPIT